MQNKITLFTLLISILYSCSDSKEKNEKAPLTTNNATNSSDKPKYTDTIKTNSHTYYIHSVTPSSYKKLKSQADLDKPKEIKCTSDSLCAEELEKYRISNTGDSSLVERDSINLKLKLLNGEYLTLVNQSCETDECIQYYFINFISDMGLYLIDVNYYEGSDFLIVNAHDGKQFFVAEYPVISPDRKKLITTSSDMLAGFNFNGIFILEMVNNELKQDLKYESMNWGPSEPEWIDNNHVKLVQEVVYTDEKGNMKEGKRYCTLTIE